MKFSFIVKPVSVLTVICLTVALLLSCVHLFPAPQIEKNQSDKAFGALKEVYPDGEFTADSKLNVSEYAVPSEIKEIYKEASGGYVFVAEVTAYQSGLRIMCGIDPEGKIVASKVLSGNETHLQRLRGGT